MSDMTAATKRRASRSLRAVSRSGSNLSRKCGELLDVLFELLGVGPQGELPDHDPDQNLEFLIGDLRCGFGPFFRLYVNAHVSHLRPQRERGPFPDTPCSFAPGQNYHPLPLVVEGTQMVRNRDPLGLGPEP